MCNFDKQENVMQEQTVMHQQTLKFYSCAEFMDGFF
jgi:hypothetical protein